MSSSPVTYWYSEAFALLLVLALWEDPIVITSVWEFKLHVKKNEWYLLELCKLETNVLSSKPLIEASISRRNNGSRELDMGTI